MQKPISYKMKVNPASDIPMKLRERLHELLHVFGYVLCDECKAKLMQVVNEIDYKSIKKIEKKDGV